MEWDGMKYNEVKWMELEGSPIKWNEIMTWNAMNEMEWNGTTLN